MPIWSSPFPCRPSEDWGAPVPFPGPEGSVLIFDSPDRVLQHWNQEHGCDGAELERFHQGCRQLFELREQGNHAVQACWSSSGNAPPVDGVLASLLLLILQASPDCLEAYLQLDPHYLHRLIRAQHQPRQLLMQWLNESRHRRKPDQPQEQQLQSALKELEQRQAEQLRVETLIDQHQDQQRRSRRLLAGRLGSLSSD